VSDRFALGIVGCGRLAESVYVPALRRLDDLALVAVADARPERAAAVASRFPGCSLHDCVEALLDAGKASGLLIATPAAKHVAIADRALAAGIPVLIEKPLASSFAEAEPWLEGDRQRVEEGVMMAFNRRYWEPVRHLRERLLAGVRPPDGPIEMTMTGDIRGWDAIEERSDPLLDLASHQFDLLRHLFGGEIEAVCARRIDPATFRMRVRLAGSVAAACIVSHAGRSAETLAVTCGSERLFVRRGSDRTTPARGLRRRALDGIAAANRRLRGGRSSFRRSYEDQLRAFVRFARREDRDVASIGDGIAALRAVEAARRSATQGGVEVPLLP